MSRPKAPEFAVEPANVVEGWNGGWVRIGRGALGGKADGLVFFSDMLAAEYRPERFAGLEVAVPSFAVLSTEVFDSS